MRLRTAAALAACALALAAAPAAPAMAAPAAACTRNLPVSHNADLVVMAAVQTCGYSYRAWGFWPDGFHYGTYTKVDGRDSVACDLPATCAGTLAGPVSYGGYQVKRTGREVCTFGCAARGTR